MEIDNCKGILVSENNSNVCRVCLTTNQNNQCIFDIKQSNSNNIKIINLLEKLRLCSGLEILENDGLPNTVCMKCIMKINDAHELRKQCQQSDTRLRELYGKLKKEYDIDRCKITKDKWCQTDYSIASDFVKDENCTSAIDHDSLSTLNLNSNVKPTEENKINNESNRVKQDEFNNCLNKQTTRVKSKAESEKHVTGRDAYRTRRMTMFKRVTSIENLKNHKERQRQYIKKNANLKWDTSENDHSTNAIDASLLKLYVCTKCGRHYSSKKSLDRHLITHHEKTFTCNKCNKHFFHLDKLVEHSKLHEIKEKPKPVLCRICNKNFRKTDTMVRHLNVHKRANPKEVLSILKEIRDRRKLESISESEKTVIQVKNNDDKKETDEKSVSRYNSMISDKQETCTLQTDCKSPTSALLFLDVNASENDSFDNNMVYKCKYCTKRYTTEKSLQRHLLVHADKKFVCNVCNMKFYREDRLQSHKNRYGHDENKISPEVQKPSDEKSTIKLINSWIREELDSDNEEKGFPCKICGKSYDTKKSLSKHQLSTHNSEEEGCASCGEMCNCDEKDKEQKANEGLKPYKCSECNKSFDKEDKLQKHIMNHERPKEQQDVDFKRFLCHICSKTFRQNTGLMFHMRTHTGYKPHVCKYCGRGFASNSNRINHERTHTGDRPFVCHFCSAAFAKSCTLKAHITTHTGEANYHCKTCGKSFRRLKYLKEHRFTHTGEKPYACKICGTAYSHSGSLFVHEKKCKAQFNSYQSNSAQSTESYCHSETSSPRVTPIITILPEVHLNVSDEHVLSTEHSKTYIDNNQMITSQNINNLNTDNPSDLHGHSNSDSPDVSLTIKSFALIRQMFQS
nr:zinc finger protein 14-like [Osmia lignaria]